MFFYSCFSPELILCYCSYSSCGQYLFYLIWTIKKRINIEHSNSIRYTIKRIAKETKELMDEQKPLENEQGEPGEKQKIRIFIYAGDDQRREQPWEKVP